MPSHVRRILGFSLLPAMSMLAPLVLLPIVAQRYGPSGWSAIALGQSVGAIVGVVVALAWPIVGGHQIARSNLDLRREIYIDSLGSRLFVLVVATPLAAVFLILLGQPLRLETILFMIGISLNGLTASWYFAGTGEPRKLVVNEGVVRLAGYALAATAMILGSPLIIYASLTIMAGLAMIVLNWWTIVARRPSREQFRFRAWLHIVRGHSYGTLSRVLQGGFSFGGVPISAAIVPGGLSSFAAADQLAKAASNAGLALPASFVGWVGQGGSALKRRSLTATMTTLAILAIAVVVWYAVGPAVVTFLYRGESGLGRAEITLIGLAIFGTVGARVLELLAVVPAGEERSIFLTNTVMSVVGLCLLPLAFVNWGVIGGLTVYAAIPIATMGTLVLVILRALRRRREDRDAASH